MDDSNELSTIDLSDEKCTGNGNQYQTTLVVHKALADLLLTKKCQESIRKFNDDYNTRIEVERNVDQTSDNKTVILIAKTEHELNEAKMKLTQFIGGLQQKLPFTHLITIPFNNNEMRQQFTAFKDSVLTEPKHSSIDETLFQNAAKLHLTICVLVLLNEDQIVKAKQLFKDCEQTVVKPILDDKPLRVRVMGLDVMNRNYSKTDILFAKVSEFEHSSRFQSIADGIVAKFVDSGFLAVEQKQNTVKLHVTLMNSLFRQRIGNRLRTKPSDSSQKMKRLKREKFDATNILEKYQNHLFAELIVPNIQLNNIKQKNEDGFYGLNEIIELPVE